MILYSGFRFMALKTVCVSHLRNTSGKGSIAKGNLKGLNHMRCLAVRKEEKQTEVGFGHRFPPAQETSYCFVARYHRITSTHEIT